MWSCVMALVAGPQTRSAFAAPAGGDAVTVWNANAGVAATAACIAPLDDPLHESRIYAMMHVSHPRCPECYRPPVSALHLRHARTRCFSGCRRCCCGTRRPGLAHRSTPSRDRLAVLHRCRRCKRRNRLYRGPCGHPRHSRQGAGYRGGTRRGGGPRPESRGRRSWTIS
jgi:hypothetical protein